MRHQAGVQEESGRAGSRATTAVHWPLHEHGELGDGTERSPVMRGRHTDSTAVGLARGQLHNLSNTAISGYDCNLSLMCRRISRHLRTIWAHSLAVEGREL